MVYRRTSDAAHAAPGLTPERHADPGPDVIAARNALALVLEVVAQESFESPCGRFEGRARANAAIQGKLTCRRRRTCDLGAGEVDAGTTSEVHTFVRRTRAHRLYNVQVRVKRHHVIAKLTDVRKSKARLEGHRLPDESHAYIDGCPELKRSAAAGAAASEMTKRGTEIDTEFVSRPGRRRPLSQRELRKRHQPDCRNDTTHEFAHYRTLQ